MKGIEVSKKMYEFNWSYAVTSLQGNSRREILTDLDSLAVNLAVVDW